MSREKNKVDKKLQIAVRSVGAILPLITLLFGLAMKYDLLPFNISFFTDTMLIFFGLFTILGFATLTLSNRPRLQLVIRIFGAEIVFMLYTLLVTGFASYLAICWLILVYESYRVFREKGMYVSLLVILVTFCLDFILKSHAINAELLYNNIVALLLVVGASVFVISMTRAQIEKEANLKLSEEKERTERGRLETLINSMSSSIISFDKNGTIQRFNAASLALLDTHAGIENLSIDQVVKLTDKEGGSVSVIEYARQLPSSAMRDDLYYHYSEETIRVEVIISPVHTAYTGSDDVGGGYIMILRDITKEKSLEEERESFISVVSHELRTPLSIAEGAIGNAIFMNEKGKLTPVVLEKSLHSVHENITSLSHIVNDLTTLSRAESSDSEINETIDVTQLIDELYKRHTSLASQKNLEFNIDRSPTIGSVQTSRLYLTDILEKLISNAFKYTSEGSVTLSAAQNGQTITISVKDTGNGIAKTDLSKIFDKFYRSEDYRTRETGGNGLGLYIASRLADKIHTKIEVTSRYEHGSEFSVTLPVAK